MLVYTQESTLVTKASSLRWVTMAFSLPNQTNAFRSSFSPCVASATFSLVTRLSPLVALKSLSHRPLSSGRSVSASSAGPSCLNTGVPEGRLPLMLATHILSYFHATSFLNSFI